MFHPCWEISNLDWQRLGIIVGRCQPNFVLEINPTCLVEHINPTCLVEQINPTV
jgi:hypothetical protein